MNRISAPVQASLSLAATIDVQAVTFYDDAKINGIEMWRLCEGV